MPGFDETLPADEYDIETELCAPPDHIGPQAWKASVVVHLHPRASHPGLKRSLTVSLADIEIARARDKLTGKELLQLFLDEMLADPMVRLVMQADGVSETQIRQVYSGLRMGEPDKELSIWDTVRNLPDDSRDCFSSQTAENERAPAWTVNLPRMGRGSATEQSNAKMLSYEQ